MTDIIWSALNSKNKIIIQYPYTDLLDIQTFICDGEIGDILGFGFSYIEHGDYLLEYIIAGSKIIKQIIQKVEDFTFSIEKSHVGTLWTSKIYITDKLPDNQIIFSNKDFSFVLHLNINNME